MKALFINVVELSITTGVVVFLWLLIQRLWGGKIKASSKYMIWSVILLRLLFPIESSLSLIKYYKSVPVVSIGSSAASSSKVDIFGILCGVWLIVATLILLFRSVVYLVFVVKVHRNSFKFKDVECAIPILVSDKVTTPCLCGLIFQKIIIPDMPDNKKALELMLEHELCHRKRLDLWIKLIDNLIKCVYWFNPFVYILSSQLTLYMEMSCDESVLKNKTRDDRVYYAEMMLRVMKGQKSSVYVPMTTGLSYGFSHVKQRFSVILSDVKRRKALIAVMIVTVLALLCGTLFGVSVIEIRPVDNNDANIEAVDSTTKSIIKDGSTKINGILEDKSADSTSESIVAQEQNTQLEDIAYDEKTTLSAIESEHTITFDTSTMIKESQLPSVTTETDTTTPEANTDTIYQDTEAVTVDSGLPKPGTPSDPPGAVYVEVFFDVNGGHPLLSSDVANNGRYEVGKPIGYLPIPMRGGHIFDGWWILDEYGNYSVLYTEDTIVTKQCVLVAKWREI